LCGDRNTHSRAVAKVFARRTIVTGAKRVQRITHSIDVVEEFADGAPRVFALANV